MRQLRFIQPQIRDERIGPGTREVVRLPRDRRKRAPHGPARREALNVRLVAVLPPLPDHSPVGGEVRARGDVAGWIDCLGEVNGGNGPPGILPVEGSDPEALRRCLHAQVLAVEVTVNQGRGEAGAGAGEPIPIFVQLIEPRHEDVEKRHVGGAESGIVHLGANHVPRRAHLFVVTGRPRIGQPGLGRRGLRLGVQDSQPPGRRGTVVRAQPVVFLTLDFPDEEPAAVLRGVLGRPRDGAVVARSRERHVRQDTLVYGTLDLAAATRAALRDHRRAIDPDAFEPVHRQVGPRLVRLELGRRDPVGHHAVRVELAPCLDRRVRQQIVAALLGQGACGGAARRRGGEQGLDRRRRRVRDDSATVDGEQCRAAGERARPVTDDDYGAALFETLQCVDDRGLGLRVHRARGLVQDQHGTVLQERARQRDALPLASRELRAALPDLSVVAPGQPRDELVRVGRLGRGDDLVAARTRRGVCDVVGDAEREQDRLLQDHGELAAQVRELVRPQVDVVEQDLPLGRIVEAGEQADERGLAGAGGPHYAEPCAPRDITGDVVQDGPVRSIGERHVAERDGPAGAPDGSGVRPLGHLGLLVEQREGTLGACEVGLDPRRLLADRLEGLVQFVEVPQRHPQLPDGEDPCDHVAHADEEDRGGPEGAR